MFEQLKTIFHFIKYKALHLFWKRSNNELHAKVFYHIIGNGEWVKVRGSDISVGNPDFDLDIFSLINFAKTMDYRNQKYIFEDCLKESFVRKGRRVVVVHARYLLDTDTVNFKNFLENLSPSDFISA